MSDAYVRRVDKSSTLHDVTVVLVKPDSPETPMVAMPVVQLDASEAGITIHSRLATPTSHEGKRLHEGIDDERDDWSFWPWALVVRIYRHRDPSTAEAALELVERKLIVPGDPILEAEPV